MNGFFADTGAGESDDVEENDTPEVDPLLDVTAKGLGDLVGEEEIGDGEGVLAKGLKGM